MKLYTSELQTAKLIELGFEKPNGIVSVSLTQGDMVDMCGRYDTELEYEYAYTIGELLSFLPKEIKVEKYNEPAYIQILYDEEGVWEVGYTFYGNGMYIKRDIEFIDCLLQMCVKLKEEGVI